MRIGFEVLHKDEKSNGRVGIARTMHGTFQTPAFMPVGTRGTVKGLLPNLIADTGSEIILGNTYHLMLRPGLEIIEQAGGLHKFVGWDGSMLTDSGGFQVFSLAELRKIDDEGVTFSSHIDGQIIRLEPASVIEAENRLGADIIMTFDECPKWPVDFARAKEAVERTIRWAEICKEVHRKEGQGLFGIVQGSMFAELRDLCLRKIVEIGFDGYALGGLSVGEGAEERKKIVDEFGPKLPENKLRYLMGVGRPIDIAESVAAGIDMFDCVLPTRNGRNGYAFTSKGAIKLRNEKYKLDFSPIDKECNCYCCRRFTRAYVRHLFLVGEMLGPILLSLHNIAFFQNFMRKIRVAIRNNNLREFVEKVRDVWENEERSEDC